MAFEDRLSQGSAAVAPGSQGCWHQAVNGSTIRKIIRASSDFKRPARAPAALEAALSPRKQHPYIPTLIQQFADKQVGRRDFLRTATLLGLSAVSAYGIAGTFDGLDGPARAQESKPQGGTLRLSTTVYDVKSPATASTEERRVGKGWASKCRSRWVP